MITIKSAKEIALMREAGRIVKETLEFVGRNIRAGMTTKQVDELVNKYIVSCGAIPSSLGYCGFPGSACVSVNEVAIHGIPSDLMIANGDIVSVDVTVEKDGYSSDACRTFLIGEVAEERKQLVKVTEECFYKGLAEVRDGAPLGDVSAAIQEHAESFGYGVIREFVGHGIGKTMHEDPNVPNYGKRGTGVRLKSGMTICIEPMINLGDKAIVVDEDGWTVRTRDGKCSAHYENTVLVTREGAEILTI